MNEVLKNIYGRRSVRAYSDEPVSEEVINEIIKAGFHAPNGMNVQALRFVVVQKRELLTLYSEIGKRMSITNFKNKLEAAVPQERMGLERLIENLSNPKFDIFYGAPVLILVFAAPEALTPNEDGALAAENMMLAAHSMGIGSCWIGFAGALGYNPDVMKELNISSDHKLIAPLIFGHPKKGDMAPSQRMEVPIVKWIK